MAPTRRGCALPCAVIGGLAAATATLLGYAQHLRDPTFPGKYMRNLPSFGGDVAPVRSGGTTEYTRTFETGAGPVQITVPQAMQSGLAQIVGIWEAENGELNSDEQREFYLRLDRDGDGRINQYERDHCTRDALLAIGERRRKEAEK